MAGFEKQWETTQGLASRGAVAFHPSKLQGGCFIAGGYSNGVYLHLIGVKSVRHRCSSSA